MTITNAEAVKEILRNGGKDDEGFLTPFVYKYRAIHSGDVWLYALFTDAAYDDMSASPFITEYACLMANGILTLDGKAFINE